MKGALVIPKLMYINFYAEKINKKASARLAMTFSLNNSSCRTAAKLRNPRSIANYVTGVSRCSQHTCGLKYDGKI
ncbi:hypothetical protein A936_00295 [Enterobacter sp. Ag1]|nr:hypothetical protein A936_00295 [Enterobacter sp. Ag1]